MALRPDYCTLGDLTSYLFRDTGVASASEQTLMALDITTASRAVDQFCNRQFGITGSAIQRLYTWHGDLVDCQQAVQIDDLMTTVGLVVTADTNADFTYATTLVNNTDFFLYPFNAVADGVPWTHIVRRQGTVLPWPAPASRTRAFSVVANWGWTTVPSAVEIATLIQASRLFARRDAQFGIAGSPELGSEMRLQAKLDVDLQTSLMPYRRSWGAA